MRWVVCVWCVTSTGTERILSNHKIHVRLRRINVPPPPYKNTTPKERTSKPSRVTVRLRECSLDLIETGRGWRSPRYDKRNAAHHVRATQLFHSASPLNNSGCISLPIATLLSSCGWHTVIGPHVGFVHRPRRECTPEENSFSGYACPTTRREGCASSAACTSRACRCMSWPACSLLGISLDV